MALRKLSELADWQVSDKDKDIRGKDLYQRDGERIGTIEELLVDTDSELVRTIILDNGERFSADDIDINSEGVSLNTGSTHSTTGSSTQRPKVQVYRHGDDSERPRAR